MPIPNAVRSAVVPLALLLQPIAAAAAITLPSGQTICATAPVGYRILELERTAPDSLTVIVEIQNKSGVPYRFLSSRAYRYAQLVDDHGDEWKYGVTDIEDRVFAPDVRTKARFQFARAAGGRTATTVNFSNKLLIVGSKGACTFDVKDIPLAAAR
jgi:hypothetical protein